MGELLLVRHGETDWSRLHRYTGLTDVPLTRHGEGEAQALAPSLARRHLIRTLVSPLQRAQNTAHLARAPHRVTDPDLREWDYGGYEGLTPEAVRHRWPDWDLWRDGPPPGPPTHPGESLEEVGARCDRVLRRTGSLLSGPDGDGDVAVVAHAHVLCILAARYLGLPPSFGACFTLGAASVCRLGTQQGRPVLLSWNRHPSTTSRSLVAAPVTKPRTRSSTSD